MRPKRRFEYVNADPRLTDALTLLALRKNPYPSPGVGRAIISIESRILHREEEEWTR